MCVCVLIPEGVVGLKSVNFSSLSSVVAADLDYCDVEWFALEMNRDYSVVFEIESKYCILDSC